MGRLARGMLTGGVIAAAAGMLMRKQNTRQNMMNQIMNTAINLAGSMGFFRMFSRTKMFRNMIKMR